MRYRGPAHGSPAPRRWLAAVVWPTPAPQRVLQESGRAVPEPTERRHRLEQARQEPSHTWRLAPAVEACQAFRGGTPLVGVKRRQATRGPRPLLGPDGPKEGGTQATASSRSTRRLFLAPALPRTQENGSQLLTPEVISTLGLSCGEQRERGTSGRCVPSAPGPC
jgi:hypothetical protein